MENNQNDEYFDEQFKRVKNINIALDEETDRGCCLLAVSFLDNEIQNLLKSKLVGSKKFIEKLFEFNGPIGTLSSKIKLAFSIGLICKELMDDLELLRKIRNQFGHSYEPINFKTQSIHDNIQKLKGHFYQPSENAEPRMIFTNCVLTIIGQMNNAEINLAKISEMPTTDSHNVEFQKEMRIKIKEITGK
ncbi:MltR family transcriptional regulator [Flavobacterium procerum]|uniref:MltR family transcriptional regulator n=1 Tax=Flavobacterium procerum TaxID=1455569 RepID=A0ABV6BQT8_9FLAO